MDRFIRCSWSCGGTGDISAQLLWSAEAFAELRGASAVIGRGEA
jgi:hypothetical protein